MNHERMNRQELKDAMADYLGGELPADQAIRYERSLQGHPDLDQEVRELGGALQAMQSLESDEVASSLESPSNMTPRSWGKGHTMRLVAMITLAFFVGYIVKGLEPGALQTTPSPSEQVGDENSIPKSNPDNPEESFSTRYAMEYLADGKRSGLSRSLIAYSRAAKKNSTKD